MDKEIVARRLSGAIGNRVDAGSVVRVAVRTVGGVDLVDVELSGDLHYTLAAGNVAFGGKDEAPGWWKNGVRITPDEGVKAVTVKMVQNRPTM